MVRLGMVQRHYKQAGGSSILIAARPKRTCAHWNAGALASGCAVAFYGHSAHCLSWCWSRWFHMVGTGAISVFSVVSILLLSVLANVHHSTHFHLSCLRPHAATSGYVIYDVQVAYSGVLPVNYIPLVQTGTYPVTHGITVPGFSSCIGVLSFYNMGNGALGPMVNSSLVQFGYNVRAQMAVGSAVACGVGAAVAHRSSITTTISTPPHHHHHFLPVLSGTTSAHEAAASRTPRSVTRPSIASAQLGRCARPS